MRAELLVLSLSLPRVLGRHRMQWARPSTAGGSLEALRIKIGGFDLGSSSQGCARRLLRQRLLLDGEARAQMVTNFSRSAAGKLGGLANTLTGPAFPQPIQGTYTIHVPMYPYTPERLTNLLGQVAT